MMRLGRAISPDDFNIEPESYTFPDDKDLWLKKKGKSIYIAKPKVGSEGNNCLLFKDLNELPQNLVGSMVVQKYISKPLLLDGLKFDLRIYVCVTGIEPLHAFVCEEGLARFCTEPYEAPTKSNFKDFFKHLTNYSINKHHLKYKEEYKTEEQVDIG